jgi:hypothetical protein
MTPEDFANSAYKIIEESEYTNDVISLSNFGLIANGSA